MEGPDKGWSWVIAAACFFSSLVLAGIFRTSGVLFVAFIHSFGVTREEASWPMVLCISVLNLTGPFSGILGQKFGARPGITGAIVATVGISSCFFTTSLYAITLLFGGVFGVGWGFMNTLMPGVLNAYFLNLRATANGIANSGSCFGSLILPITFEYFIEFYGLAGCFLLTGGIVLHIAILGALMRPPPWLKSTASHSLKYLETERLVSKGKSIRFPDQNMIEIQKHERVLCETEKDSMLQSTISSEDDPQDPSSKTYQSTILPTSSFENVSKKAHSVKERYFTEKDVKSSSNTFLNEAAKSESQSVKDIMHNFVIVLMCPLFYITAITNVSFYFLYHMYVVIIVDFALDRSVPAQNAKDMLFAFSIADLFGRLCFGWITDKKFVSRPKFVMICMVLIGIVFFLFPFSESYWTLIASSCAYGLLLGCTMVIFPILLVDFLGIELHAVSYGCMCFMNGFASFGRPYLIGYFRDHVGSYSSMFYVLGGISSAASLLWILESLFVKKENL
ncbi:monocarboxylate transporter 13 [Parasteatoda tepidariorum]|nr:monocarboxylate transporter 12 isoform X1 [Parasteatoda tepidariorum]XP_015926955.2 monocarboxylate transporter 12 isoform X1 [Parasteatoda tepidariorum]